MPSTNSERRRLRIMRKIRSKERIVDQCVSAKNNIRKEKIKLNDCRDDWTVGDKNLQLERITGEVVVEHVFEGNCAEQLRVRMDQAVALKISKEQQAGDFLEDVEELLSNIQNYINELEEDINDLYDSL